MISFINFTQRAVYQNFKSKKNENQNTAYIKTDGTPQRVGAGVLALLTTLTVGGCSRQYKPSSISTTVTHMSTEWDAEPTKNKINTTAKAETETTKAKITKAETETTKAKITKAEKKSEATKITEISKELAQALDKKLGKGFSAKVSEVAKIINCNPNDLLAMMYSESGLNPGLHSENGAIGLIQFMPETMDELDVKSYKLERMSGIKQMDYVEKFFIQNKKTFLGSTKTKLDAATLYSLCFLPAYAKQDVLCRIGSDYYYYSNSGLDLNRDGAISKKDLEKRINQKYGEMYNEFI